MVLQFPSRGVKLGQQTAAQKEYEHEEYIRELQEARIEAKIVELFCLTIQAVMRGEDDV